MRTAFTVSFIFLILATTVNGQKSDSLLQVISHGNTVDSVKVKALAELSKNYWYRNLDSAYLFAHRGQLLSLEIDDKISYGTFLISKGVIFYFQSENDSALYYLNNAHNLFDEISYQKGILRVYNSLGLVYSNMGDFTKAQDYYLKGIEQAEELKEYDLLASFNYNLGLVLDSQGLKEESLEYFINAYTINLENYGPVSSRINFLNGIGATFNELQLFDSGKYYLELAVSAAEENGLELSLAELYQNLGSLSLDIGKLNDAYNYYKKSEEINTRLDNDLMLAYNYQGLSAYYDHLEDQTGDRSLFLNSIEYGKKLVDLAIKIDNAERLLQGYNRVWDASYEFGDYKTAIEYHIKYSNLKDSLFKREQSDQIIAVKEQYETEKKEQQLALQHEQIEAQEARIAQEATIRNALIIGIGLLIVIVALIYRNERIKTRKNRQIEALLKEIHHRVKNNLQVISSLLNMQSRETTDEGMLGAIQEGQNRVKAMSLIHQKLYQNENITEIDFKDYATELANQLSAVFMKSDKKVKSEVKSDNIRLDIDTAIPVGLILNELISNAYKYAFDEMPEGNIEITLNRIKEGELNLKVKDNGKGLPSDFNIDEAKSLGLKLVKILTKQLKGHLSLDSQNGTIFSIDFKEVSVS